MTSVLFLCTGNACRSQMAEGWMKHHAKAKGLEWEVQSAGTVAHGLNETAVKVMAEIPIDISGQESKTIDQVDLGNVELVVTVCGDADEHCPTLGAGVAKIHWPLADPAKIRGSEDEILEGFRLIRDQIRTLTDELSVSYP